MTRSVGEGTRVPLAGVDPCNAPGAVRPGLPQKLRTSLTLIEDNNAHVFREPPGGPLRRRGPSGRGASDRTSGRVQPSFLLCGGGGEQVNQNPPPVLPAAASRFGVGG